MQKQHLHLWLPLLFAAALGGCGDPRLPQVNPYLHGEQVLSQPIPDSVATLVMIDGWAFDCQPPVAGQANGLKLKTPDGRQLKIGWKIQGESDLLPFQVSERTLRGLVLSDKSLGMTATIELSRDGRTLTSRLNAESQQPLDAALLISADGQQTRGIAAHDDPWMLNKQGAVLHLPWGDTWTVSTTGSIQPITGSADREAVISYDEHDRSFALSIRTPLVQKRERGLDIRTESETVNQALAITTALIPAGRELLPESAEGFEFWADMTAAQWLVRGESNVQFLTTLRSAEFQPWLVKYGLNAFRTVYRWGSIPARELQELEPLLDAAMSRVDTTSRDIAEGATLEDRLREATVWTFAEDQLATDRTAIRKVYREQAVHAINDAQEELKRRRSAYNRARSNRRADEEILFEQVMGSTDSPGNDYDTEFVAPDTLGLMKIASRGGMTWFSEISDAWYVHEDLPWEIELAVLRMMFSGNIKLRSSEHWTDASAALLHRYRPGQLPGANEPRDQMLAAAGEIETIVEAYLGIRPDWRAREITFDPRLPEGWGRTQARVPFDEGELYVDYDLANNRAIVAARGLKQKFKCQIYIPTTAGAISGQFNLEPGEDPHECTLVKESNDVYRIRIESSDLPE